MAEPSRSNSGSDADPNISAIFRGLQGTQLWHADNGSKERALHDELQKAWNGPYYPPQFAPVISRNTKLPSKDVLYHMRGLTLAWLQLGRLLPDLWSPNGLLTKACQKTQYGVLTGKAAKLVRDQIEKMVSSWNTSSCDASTNLHPGSVIQVSTTQQSSTSMNVPQPISKSGVLHSLVSGKTRVGIRHTSALVEDETSSSGDVANSDKRGLSIAPDMLSAPVHTSPSSPHDETRDSLEQPLPIRPSLGLIISRSPASSTAPATPKKIPSATQFRPILTPDVFHQAKLHMNRASVDPPRRPYSAFSGTSDYGNISFSDSGFQSDLSTDGEHLPSAARSTEFVTTQRKTSFPAASLYTNSKVAQSDHFAIKKKEEFRITNGDRVLESSEILLEGHRLRSNDIQACLKLHPVTPGWSLFDPGYPNLENTKDRLIDRRHIQSGKILNVVVVLHIQQNHWAVGHWDRVSSVFTLYDPLQHPSHFQQVKQFMTEWLKDSELGETEHDIKVIQGHCPQQSDTINCGIFCVAIAGALIEGTPIPLCIDVNTLRQKYAERLHSGGSEPGLSESRPTIDLTITASRDRSSNRAARSYHSTPSKQLQSRARDGSGIVGKRTSLRHPSILPPKRPHDDDDDRLDDPTQRPLKQLPSDRSDVRMLEDTFDKYSRALMEKHELMKECEREMKELEMRLEECAKKKEELERGINHDEQKINVYEQAISLLSKEC